MRKESLEFLKQLLNTPSPSGYETAAQKVWCDYARQFADDVYTDAYGNAVAVLNPAGDPRVVFDGHVDEIGLIIKHIDDKGFVYVQAVGGVDATLVRGKHVVIHTAKGTVRGITGATAYHLRDRYNEPKVTRMHDIFIDIGAKNGEAARKRVAVGDYVTFADEFTMMDQNRVAARAADSKAACWVAIEALRMAAESKKKVHCAVFACSSIQEETGLHGAHMQAGAIKPDVAIAVDITHATDSPGVDLKMHGQVKLGQGPTLSVGRENHPLVLERLRKVAGRKINLQTEAFSLFTGTDAQAFWTRNGGIPSAIVSHPVRYAHTTVELMDLRDLQQTADLLAAFALSLRKGERFAVTV